MEPSPTRPHTPGPAGRLLARGRDAEIFECGPALVVRRARDGRSLGREAEVMEHVRRHGYPVPAVHEVRAGGSELVMDRVAGPSMLGMMLRRPWRQGALGEVLADLHARLGAIAAPAGLPEMPGGGSAVVHGDLHPLNVILTGHGPVVIDWANASRGSPAFEVAQTWVILSSSEVPGPSFVGRLVRARRRAFVERFVARTGRRAEAAALLPEVIGRRLHNPRITAGERVLLTEWLASLSR